MLANDTGKCFSGLSILGHNQNSIVEELPALVVMGPLLVAAASATCSRAITVFKEKRRYENQFMEVKSADSVGHAMSKLR